MLLSPRFHGEGGPQTSKHLRNGHDVLRTVRSTVCPLTSRGLPSGFIVITGEVFVGLPALYSTDELSLWMSQSPMTGLKVTSELPASNPRSRSAWRCRSSAATVMNFVSLGTPKLSKDPSSLLSIFCEVSKRIEAHHSTSVSGAACTYGERTRSRVRLSPCIRPYQRMYTA